MKTTAIVPLLLLAGGLYGQELLPSSGRESAPLIALRQSAQREAALQDTSIRKKDAPPPDFVAVDKEPVAVKTVAPYYPELAVLAGAEGVVYVKMWIDTTGKTRDVQVVKSDNDVFNRAAIEAARQYVFTPALHEGKPVAVWVALPFKFKLSAEARDKGWEGFCNQIESMLNGDRSPAMRSAIDPDAAYIEGSQQAPLQDVLFGKEKPWLINTEKGRRHVRSTGKHQGGIEKEPFVCLIVSTENEKHDEKRIHSIVVGKNPRGALQIVLWHVSR
jgi:TonB family protein